MQSVKNYFSEFLLCKPGKHKKWIDASLVCTVFFIFYGLLFLQCPLNGSLPGDYDTWGHLGIFYENLNHFEQFIGLEDVFPSNDFFSSASDSRDSNYGAFLIQYPLYLIINSDLWWYYTFIVLIFALNGVAFYYLFNYNSKTISVFHLLKGLAFSSLGYFFGNIDGINTIFLAPLLIAVGQFIRLDSTGRLKKIKFTVTGLLLLLIGSIFSFYGFANFIIILSVLILLQAGVSFGKKGVSLLLLLFIVILTDTFILLTVSGISDDHAISTIDVFTNTYISFRWSDFFTPLKGTLFNSFSSGYLNYDPVERTHTFYPGIVVYAGAILSLLLAFKQRFVWFVLFLFGFLISIGSFVEISETRIDLPMYYFYKFVSQSFFRIPLRANLTMLFSLAVLFYFFLLSVRRTNYVLSLVILFLVLLENLPIQMPRFGSDKLISYNPVSVMNEEIKDKGVVLNLPYTYLPGVCITGRFYKSSATENIYGYWFNKNRLKAVNEITSINYQPERIALFQTVNQAIADGANASELFRKNHIDYLAVHNQFVCDEDRERINQMIKISGLSNVHTDSTFSLWEVK